MPEPILVDTAAAATYVGVRPTTLRDWRRRYQLTRYGTRRRALYDLHELHAVMRQRDADTPNGSGEVDRV